MLTDADLRAVTSFAAGAAADVLPMFEAEFPDDDRPRLALQAAIDFVQGAPRSRQQRLAAPAAHRAATLAPGRPGFHAAMAAGDAAASAYLHPLADAAQVHHILRAAAQAARAHELDRPGDPEAARQALDRAADRATPTLLAVLNRYPRTRPGTTRVTQLVHALDTTLRGRGDSGRDQR